MTNDITIGFWGDIAAQNRFNKLAKNGDKVSFFGEALSIMNECDTNIVNLEAPLIEKGSPIEKSGPNIKAPLAVAQIIKKSNIGVVCLANNHIMDYGKEGLDSTIFALEKEGLKYTGVGKNQESASIPLFLTIKDKRFSIINIAENEFGNATDEAPGAASLDLVKNRRSIIDAKDKADHVIVCIHGGHETYEYPSIRMRETYRFFIDCGADAVIGHHTHCFSGHEIYNGHPIIYSLGNFIFDKDSPSISSWNYGVVALLSFTSSGILLKLKQFSQALPGNGLSPKFSTGIEDDIFKKESLEKFNQISSDIFLKNKFNEFLNKSSLKYSLYLEPTSNKYLLGLISRRFIKSFIDKKKKTILLNIIRCESHRDMIISLLSNKK